MTDPEIIDKMENKIKLSNLLTGKKFADLELNIGKFEEKLNEFSADFTKIKERMDEIEDVLNIINLGISEYKEKLDEISSQESGIKNVPEDIEKRMMEYQNRLNSLDTNIKNIFEMLNSLKVKKEDLNKTIDETFVQNFENLKRNSERNKIEMEHVKRDLDAFSSTIKSFERTLELMNLDSVIKRFESVDNKIMNAQTQIQEFRGNLNNLTFSAEDLKVVKNQVYQISSSLTEKFDKINELEKNIRILKQKMTDTNFFETPVKRRGEGSFDERDVRIDELTTRLDKLSEEVTKLLPPEVTEHAEMPSADLTEIEEIHKNVKEMYEEISTKMSELKDLEEKIKSPENVEEETLTHDANRTIAKINERIINLENRHNELVDVLQAELQTVKEFTSSETGASLKGTGEIERAIIARDRDLEEYKKQVDKKFKMIEKMKFSGLPKDLIEEINLMKETLVRLSTENQELRKLGREITISHLESVNLQTFNALTEKVTLLEKKISEIEESVIKEITTQAQKKEIIDGLKKEIEDSRKILESKIIGIESSKERLVSEMDRIEKKLKEEDIAKPIILE